MSLIKANPCFDDLVSERELELEFGTFIGDYHVVYLILSPPPRVDAGES